MYKTADQLLGALPPFLRVSPQTTQQANPNVYHITADSREVQPGSLFVARLGGSTDGHQYVAQAIARGAVGVVGEHPSIMMANFGIPYWQVSNATIALAWLAAAWHDFPSRKLVLIGVTGTDGKTTTSNLVYQILQQAGIAAGLISTVNAVIGHRILDTGLHVTTPDAPAVQSYLAQMVAAGLTHCVLEVTSHGLAQERVAACDFDIAVLTNITHEHLDYHGSFAAYQASKARLFTGLAQASTKGLAKLAVLNRDDASFGALDAQIGVPIASYGTAENATLKLSNIAITPQAAHPLSFTLATSEQALSFSCQIAGAFNAWNTAAAVAACHIGLAIPLSVCQAGVAALSGVAGRMERIDVGQPFTAVVDFAHTPNALAHVLRAARQLTTGKVIVVFGSAGLRDRDKRRLMPQVAAPLADYIILTAEDPRTESLDSILQEMAAACQTAGGVPQRTFWCIPDRWQALQFAVALAQAGDLLLACGKAHEQSLCFGTVEYPWDERQALQAALCQRQGLPFTTPPPLPTASQNYG